MPVGKIGFCCKWMDSIDGKRNADLNVSTTTVAWLKRQTRADAEKKLADLVIQNLQSTYNLVEKVSNLDPHLRMLRLGGEILPVYTEPTFSYFYKTWDIRTELTKRFKEIGDLARKQGVRLSFHPSQYTVLASADDDVVNRSIEDFEYHTDMARWMGYGSTWHDHGFKINVHISGKRGPQGIIDVLPRLSPEARNLITIENDENGHGLEDILELENHVALVLDVHHHWIRNAEYLDIQDDRVQRVVNSWRGVRPVLHYSVSREDILKGHDPMTLPDILTLQKNGHKRQHLRAHSDFYWNNAANEWVRGYWNTFDIQCESKAKNLASIKLYESWKDHINSLSS